MMNDEIKQFALKLLHANSEAEVVQILKDAGFWDDRSLWRLYGDKEGNFAQVGNQQSSPEGALVEKVVNCVDARILSRAISCSVPSATDGRQVNQQNRRADIP